MLIIFRNRFFIILRFIKENDVMLFFGSKVIVMYFMCLIFRLEV